MIIFFSVFFCMCVLISLLFSYLGVKLVLIRGHDNTKAQMGTNTQGPKIALLFLSIRPTFPRLFPQLELGWEKRPPPKVTRLENNCKWAFMDFTLLCFVCLLVCLLACLHECMRPMYTNQTSLSHFPRSLFLSMMDFPLVSVETNVVLQTRMTSIGRRNERLIQTIELSF